MDANRRSTRTSSTKVEGSAASTVQVQANTQGNTDSIDFQAFVIEKLTSLDTLPAKVAEIHKATEQLIQENGELKNAIQYSSEQVATLNETIKNQAKEVNELSKQLNIERQQRVILACQLEEQ